MILMMVEFDDDDDYYENYDECMYAMNIMMYYDVIYYNVMYFDACSLCVIYIML